MKREIDDAKCGVNENRAAGKHAGAGRKARAVTKLRSENGPRNERRDVIGKSAKRDKKYKKRELKRARA